MLRHSLFTHDEYTAGVYFCQKLEDASSTVLTFYNHEALRINNDISKKIEKAFFKDAFRRVDYSKIGKIYESDQVKEYQMYKDAVKNLLNSHQFKCVGCRIAVDMMHGMATELFPEVLNEMGVDNIMFNAYADESSLENINKLIKRSTEDMGAVIKALKLNAGFMIYPYGQRLDIVCDDGIPLGKQGSLYAVLTLLNMQAKKEGIKKNVFLPTWAADIVYFDSLNISRGQYANFTSKQLKQYDLIATGEGNFTFIEFSTHRDSMYATLKILEMMISLDVTLSKVIASMPKFYYQSSEIKCPQALKGKMMRMFLEDAHGKESSTLDGVKIWLDTNDWILMIPDQYNDHLNIYIQAESTEKGEKILADYSEKISEWSKL